MALGNATPKASAYPNFHAPPPKPCRPCRGRPRTASRPFRGGRAAAVAVRLFAQGIAAEFGSAADELERKARFLRSKNAPEFLENRGQSTGDSNSPKTSLPAPPTSGGRRTSDRNRKYENRSVTGGFSTWEIVGIMVGCVWERASRGWTRMRK